MKDILSRSCLRSALAGFARAPVLLAFDFDGTLAPTVPERDQAQMRSTTHELFRQLCRLYPCAVISGRSRQDVRRRLGSALVHDVIGNHGLEPHSDMAPLGRQIAALRPRLAKALEMCDGLEIEDKRYTLALHYRRCSNKTTARRAIFAAIATLTPRIRLVQGKLVVNVIPRQAPHKGDALMALWQQLGVQKALYVGDDVTDEDVFQLTHGEKLVSVRVGRSRSSAASYFLRSQAAMDPFLAHLCQLRAGFETE